MAQSQTNEAGADMPTNAAAELEPAYQGEDPQQQQEERLADEVEDERPTKRQKLDMDKKNKRLITAANSKLGKVDLAALLTKPEAWSALPLDTREHLYSLLPAPDPDNNGARHDPDINPLESKFGGIIREELQVWQEELRNGYETAKWRNEAVEAGRERLEGCYDEWKDAAKEDQWGRLENEENEVPEEVEGARDGNDRDEDGGADDEGSEIVLSKANVKVEIGYVPLRRLYAYDHSAVLTMPAPAARAKEQRRLHNLHLIDAILRQESSPFTLILDSLEQSARPLIAEYIRRSTTKKEAKVHHHVVFVSFTTLKAPAGIDKFFEAWDIGDKDSKSWVKEVRDYLDSTVNGWSALQAPSPQQDRPEHGNAPRKPQSILLIIDSLNHLASTPHSYAQLPALLSSFLGPVTSVVAVYHTDVPLPIRMETTYPYNPDPLTSLRYSATTIFQLESLNHALAIKAARGRRYVDPTFGLDEEIEGVIQGLGANSKEGLALHMEHRRKTGRTIKEAYYLPLPINRGDPSGLQQITLLSDHPQFQETGPEQETTTGDEDGLVQSTFDLKLSEQQKKDRANVNLPYYDAQTKGQAGLESGRILYDMGSEDDFDEEEDEI
ncbi:Elongator subunit Iki1 [Teratosphaeria destructans]|uniref:Elongator complex protein 5 n=1 Tax=Teratosphaeria destructans TaxID=418781 RepID=A0A9W7W4G5_9PEZI|nr:Elongator subunit Iki1 [Teratosphaeria destructans]